MTLTYDQFAAAVSMTAKPVTIYHTDPSGAFTDRVVRVYKIDAGSDGETYEVSLDESCLIVPLSWIELADGEADRWLQAFGPDSGARASNYVLDVSKVPSNEGLVEFSDGSRYGGAK